MRPTLISFDLRAGFGVFKKPDVNEGLQLTFNMLHKPALFGILGAIAGLEGYQRRGEFPAYYQTLRDLRVGIEPLDHEKGNFTKTVVKYTNTVGYANADGNLIVTEQTLRSPAYRCYLLPDLDDPVQARLHDRIRAGEAEFLPYFGKNECSAWWEASAVQEYACSPFQTDGGDFRVNSVFIREYPIRSQRVKPRFSPSAGKVLHASSFAYFERLPFDFFAGNNVQNEPQELFPSSESKSKPMSFVQYDLAEFVFTDWFLQKGSVIHDLFEAKPKDGGEPRIVHLF